MNVDRTGGGRPEVLVVHARGRWTGLPRLPKLCRRAGARVTVFAPPGTDLWQARHVDARVAAPAAKGAFAAALRRHLAAEPDRYAWVLLGDEEAVVELAAEPDPSWLRGWFPVEPTPDNLARITSKAAFVAAAADGGPAIPLSHVCHGPAEADRAASTIGYPVILKAARGFGGDGVRLARTAAELAEQFARLSGRTPVVVQRFEVGRVGSTQVLFDRGRPACWASSYKLAVFPEPFGPSTAREMMVHPDMRPTLDRVGRVTGFHGLCGVDWLHRTADGALLVLEFNPRPAPVVHLGHHCGVDFAAAIGDLLRGVPATRPPADVGPRTVYLFPQHVQRCIDKRRWRELAHWLPGAAQHDLPWDQPRLLARHSLMLTGRLFGAARWAARDRLRRWRPGR